MKCFYHLQSDAVGICKNCQKGLCMECAVDVGDGLACKNRCEEQVKAANIFMKRNQVVVQNSGTGYAMSVLIWVVLALFFFALGLIDAGSSMLSYVFLGAGGLFLVIAVYVFSVGRKVVQIKDKSTIKPIILTDR